MGRLGFDQGVGRLPVKGYTHEDVQDDFVKVPSGAEGPSPSQLDLERP
jgi:hypothetical protein